MIKSAMNPVLHLVAVLLAWVDMRISLFLYAGIPVMFFVPTKLERLGGADKAES